MALEKGMDQRKLIKRLKDSGRDVTEAKEWFKKLGRIRKLSAAATGKYQSALKSLQEAERICMCMDELLMADSFAIDKRRILSLTKDLKKQRNRFDHLFVISPADTQFHLIYDTVLKMGSAYTGADGEHLIFQSEVENLLDLMRDCLRRRQPNLFAYTFYRMEYGEEPLANLPMEECLAKVKRVCQREFIDVMVRILIVELGEEEQSAIEYAEGLCRVVQPE